jgi:hypothetical protein
MTPLFTSLQPSNVVRLFSSVLLERSILVVATDSGPLFDTLEALRALVFPLTWYHIYLPALPDAFEGMTDNLGAPVTYLMGCAKGAEMLMDNVKFENCVVADLDDDVVSQYEFVGLRVQKVAVVVGSGDGQGIHYPFVIFPGAHHCVDPFLLQGFGRARLHEAPARAARARDQSR